MSRILVVEPSASICTHVSALLDVFTCPTAEVIPASFAPKVVVFAVKPQVLPEVVPAYRRYADPNTTFLSVAAGAPMAFFRQHLGKQSVIVRAMPNTPAAVGRGMSIVYTDGHTTADQRAACQSLLEATGHVAWVDDEELIHAASAVSSSGPAYVFLLAECLAEAGVAVELPADLATEISRVTVAGSGALLERSELPAGQLRKDVTSQGGMTAEALAVLMGDDGLRPLFRKAVAAAAQRSRELGRYQPSRGRRSRFDSRSIPQ